MCILLKQIFMCMDLTSIFHFLIIFCFIRECVAYDCITHGPLSSSLHTSADCLLIPKWYPSLLLCLSLCRHSPQLSVHDCHGHDEYSASISQNSSSASGFYVPSALPSILFRRRYSRCCSSLIQD